MKVLIPENAVLWTANGICFGKELSYGAEIFTIDAKKNLVISPVIEDVDEPEEIKVHTIITKNNICTMIPNYKIHLAKKSIQAKEIKKNDKLVLADPKYIQKFKKYHDEKALEFLEKTPFSAIGASYLGSSRLKENKEAVCFDKADEKSMNEFAKKLREDMADEFGDDISFYQGVNKGFEISTKKVHYTVLYRSDRFYKLRSAFRLTEDKILNSIYSNGLNIYFGFLRSLFNGGFVYHLNAFSRGTGANQNIVLNIPWRSKIRKLLQSSCFLWQVYKISVYQLKPHMSLDELKIERYSDDVSSQPIVEIKEHLASCYEIEIPTGHKIIMDNVIVEPVELTDKEIEELQMFEEEQELDLAGLRKKITASIVSDSLILKKINELVHLKNPFGIHIVGIIKNKGDVTSSKTVYGHAFATNAIISDETGEIQIKLWGEISKEIKDGDVVELVGGYVKNGILQNSKNGQERIHKI